ncbi:MAG: hypothetical protein AAGB05_15135 [Pseudomonadota bacterium]
MMGVRHGLAAALALAGSLAGAPLLAQSYELLDDGTFQAFLDKRGAASTGPDVPTDVRISEKGLIEFFRNGARLDCLPYALRVPGAIADDLGFRAFVESSEVLPGCLALLQGLYGADVALRSVPGATAPRFQAITEADRTLVASLQAKLKQRGDTGVVVEALPVVIEVRGQTRRLLLRARGGEAMDMGIPTDPDGDGAGFAGLRPAPSETDIIAIAASAESGISIENPCTPFDAPLGADCLSSAVGIAARTSPTAPCDLRGSGAVIDRDGRIALTAYHVSRTVPGAATGGMVAFAGNQSDAQPSGCPETTTRVDRVFPTDRRVAPRIDLGTDAFADWKTCTLTRTCSLVDLAVLSLAQPMEIREADGAALRVPHHPILRASAVSSSQVDAAGLFGMAAGYGLDSAKGAAPADTTRGEKRRGFFRIGDCNIAEAPGCAIGIQFPSVTEATLMFADGTEVSADACYYDSGAPLYVEMSDGSLAIVGLMRQRIGSGGDCSRLNTWVNLTNPKVQDWLLREAARLVGVSRAEIERRVLTAPTLELMDTRPRASTDNPPQDDRG